MTTAAFTRVTGIPRSALRAHVHPIGRAPRAHRLAFWALACPGFVHERVQEHQNEGSQMRRGAGTKHRCRSIEDRLQPHACAPSHARRLSTFGLRAWGASGCGGPDLRCKPEASANGTRTGERGGPRAGSESACTCRRRGRWGGRARSRVGRTTRWAGWLEPDGVSRDQTCAPSFGRLGDRVNQLVYQY